MTTLLDELAADEDLAQFRDRGDSIDLAELKEMIRSRSLPGNSRKRARERPA